MPYIAIKGYVRDQATKETVVEKINEIFLEHWACPPEAITISIEEFSPEDWEEQVGRQEIEKKTEHMMILEGQRRYPAK